MNDSKVCDASALVALLLDNGPAGQWATEQLRGSRLDAPSLVAFEAANIIRRHELAGLVSADQAAQAHVDLIDLAITTWPYDVLAERVWKLRQNLTCSDASYVALAEFLDAPLVTLDTRIAAAPQLRCSVVTP